jgi:hypothetical protein
MILVVYVTNWSRNVFDAKDHFYSERNITEQDKIKVDGV